MAPLVHTCHTSDRDHYCELLAAEIDALAALTATADPARPVPTCPDWNVRELVEHIGTIHRWAAHMVAARSPERVSPRKLDLGIPESPDGLPGWIEAGGEILLGALRAAEPDDEMWAWGADKHVRFWPRRMVHETAVHRADLAIATGAPADI